MLVQQGSPDTWTGAAMPPRALAAQLDSNADANPGRHRTVPDGLIARSEMTKLANLGHLSDFAVLGGLLNGTRSWSRGKRFESARRLSKNAILQVKRRW